MEYSYKVENKYSNIKIEDIKAELEDFDEVDESSVYCKISKEEEYTIANVQYDDIKPRETKMQYSTLEIKNSALEVDPFGIALEFINDLEDNKEKEYAIANVVQYDDIKPSETKVQHSTLEVTNSTLAVDPYDIAIEFINDLEDDKESTGVPFLYCDECNEKYDVYCLKCPMLVHIMHNTRSEGTDDVLGKTLPKNILEIKILFGSYGVFALKTIPKGVVFGPFEGLIMSEKSTGHAWIMDSKKLRCTESSNWMKYVACADRPSQQNLVIFQYKDELFFRTRKEVNASKELLLWFDRNRVTNSSNNKEKCYQPMAEAEFKNVYACTFCCLGFSSDSHLLQHKVKCPGAVSKEEVIEIVQCASCDIYLGKSEYQDHHMIDCSQKSASFPFMTLIYVWRPARALEYCPSSLTLSYRIF